MSLTLRVVAALAITAVVAAVVVDAQTRAGAAAAGAQFAADGTMTLPTGHRSWVFIGAPLTPNALNGGKAGFPEYHNVYVQPAHLAAYQRTGSFPEGTVIVKELVLLRPGTHADGSADTPAGRGYSQGEFNGMDVTVKDSKRFAATNGWGFFNFGHHALPYNATAKPAPRAECAYCHIAGASKTDLTWVDFYPILRGKN